MIVGQVYTVTYSSAFNPLLIRRPLRRYILDGRDAVACYSAVSMQRYIFAAKNSRYIFVDRYAVT